MKQAIQQLIGEVNRYAKVYDSSIPLWQRLIEQHQKGKEERPHWCFLTMREVADIQENLASELDIHDELRQSSSFRTGFVLDLSAITALGTWQVTRGYYKYDETLANQLWNTPITGDLPGDMLKRLPEWCVYIKAPPEATYLDHKIVGFWAHLDRDPRGWDEARILPHIQHNGKVPPWIPIGIPLGGTLAEGVQQFCKIPGIQEEMMDLAGRALSLMLYLCTEKPDYDDQVPMAATPKQIKRAVHPRKRDEKIYTIGRRIGTALRQPPQSNKKSTGGGGEKSFHMRKQHWHSFWVGKRGQQTKEKRFIPTLEIRADKLGENETVTVHQVGDAT